MENVLWYKILEYLQARDILHQNSGNENKEFLAQQAAVILSWHKEGMVCLQKAADRLFIW